MARIWSSGLELNTTTAGVEFDSLSGTGSISSTTKRSGTYSFRSNPSASTGYIIYSYGASGYTGKTYLRVYVTPVSYTDALDSIIALRDSDGAAIGSIRMNTTGTLELWDDDNTVQLGSDSAALALNVSYCVEIFADNNGTNATALTARLDGTQFATGSQSVTGNLIANQVRIGAATNTTCDLYFDDIAINDASGSFQNSYPGFGQIIHLQPNAAGDNSDWSGDYTDIDEVTPDDGSSDIVETIGSNIHDVNLAATPTSLTSSDTITCVQVGSRFASSAAVAMAPFVLRIKASASGTVEESGGYTYSSSTWVTNKTAAPRNYDLTLYDLPGASSTAWAKSNLDAAQIGVRTTSNGTTSARLSTLWLLVDYAKPATELPVVSGLYLHLDATKQVYSDAGTTPSTNGGAVHQWNDLIFGNHAIQATGTNQPLYRTSGINSIASIDFDGSNDYLATGNTTFGVFTQFVVFKLAGTAGMITERGSGAAGDYIYGTTGNTTKVARTLTSAKELTADWSTDDTTKIVTKRYGGTHATHRLWINGVDQSPTGAGDDPGTDSYTNVINIGGRTTSLPIDGYIGEIIYYNRELSDSEREDVEDYLTTKWIPAAVGGAHRLLTMRVGN